MKGILVVGHGSRSKDAHDVFFRIVDSFKSRVDMEVEGCFMEISEPNMQSTVEKMYKKGIRDITVIPYFLFQGIHMKEDIPESLVEIKDRYNDLNITMADSIGYHEALVDILIERFEGDKKCI